MKRAEQSNLHYLLTSRPLLVKRNGMHLCLHDAFSGEVLAGQRRLEIVQEAGEVTVLKVELVLDGKHVRMVGE
jgi:ParB-like chromosome segregation protein Spo0J